MTVLVLLRPAALCVDVGAPGDGGDDDDLLIVIIVSSLCALFLLVTVVVFTCCLCVRRRRPLSVRDEVAGLGDHTDVRRLRPRWLLARSRTYLPPVRPHSLSAGDLHWGRPFPSHSDDRQPIVSTINNETTLLLAYLGHVITALHPNRIL